MGRALEIVTGRVVAPGAALTGLTMSAGNTLTVRNAPLDSDVRLISLWVDVQAAGVLRIRSPRLHDNVQGIRFTTVPSEPKDLIPRRWFQKLVPQDLLIAELSGSAVGGDIENAAMLLYYSNLPGVDARLATVEEVLKRTVNIVTVENTIAAGAGGGYTGEEALNAEFDLLRANTDYALLGYTVSVECGAVRWRGADTGNLGVGGPGDELARDLTENWFIHLSEYLSLPLIPVFNSANKAGVLIDVLQDENAAAVTVNSIFAEIGPAAAGPAR